MVAVMNNIEGNKDLQAAAIAVQNDLFRKAMVDPAAAIVAAQKGIVGQVFLTQGVSGEGQAFVAAAMEAVAIFSIFTEDNDPYCDHSFGAVEVNGEKLFWKIDLYDTEYVYGSDRPFDPGVTRRVLTIMTPSEY